MHSSSTLLWDVFFKVSSSLTYLNASRPANILLSSQNVPVLVDFGFAEKYELKQSKAFHSNLSYGTPEVHYLLLRFTINIPDYFVHSISPPNVHAACPTIRVNRMSGHSASPSLKFLSAEPRLNIQIANNLPLNRTWKSTGPVL